MYGSITPGQVAEMAQAGVKIDFKDIADHLDCSPGPVRYSHDEFGSDDLTRRLRERLYRPASGGLADKFAGMLLPFMASTFARDGVIVTFLVADGTPVMLEDDARLFPSDALITKIRLLETK